MIVAATLNSGGNNGGFRTEPGEHLVAAPRVARQAKGSFTDPANDNIIPVIATTFNGYTGGADDNDAQGGHLVVAFQSRYYTRDNKTGGQPRETADITNAHKAGDSAPYVVAFTERTRREGRTLEAQEGLAYALTNPGSGGRTHSRQIAGGFGVRRLTPVECERLQGFPDGWTAGQSDSTRYRQLGNAVAVPVVEWIGRRIVAAEEAAP